MSWLWNLEGGWLRDLKFFDRGGSVVIYFSASLAGIVGAVIIGPRYGRYMKKNEKERLKTLNINNKSI